MRQERFFRLLSIAILGACALAIVPEVKPSTADSSADSMMIIATPEMELQAAQDVEQINSGKFKPYVSGDVSPTYDSGQAVDSGVITN
jgi:hypothetical protein